MSTSARLSSFFRKRITVLAWLALIGLALGQMGQWHWFLELFSHFVPYYAVCFLLGCLAATRTWQRLMFGVCAIGTTLWTITPLPSVNDSANPAEPTLQIVSYNLLFSNAQQQQESAWIEKLPADVIFLTEVSTEWQYYLKTLEENTQHCSQYIDSPFGIALYSRVPLEQCDVLYQEGNNTFPYIRAELPSGLVIYGIHPPPPLGRQLASERDEMLQYLAQQIAQEKDDVIVLGDMNITPFSPLFRDFTRKAQLQLSSPRGRPTWRPGFLPIDHILVHNLQAVRETGTFSWQGSDHRAIWLRYALPASTAHAQNEASSSRHAGQPQSD